jgi:hypothetical protein
MPSVALSVRAQGGTAAQLAAPVPNSEYLTGMLTKPSPIYPCALKGIIVNPPARGDDHAPAPARKTRSLSELNGPGEGAGIPGPVIVNPNCHPPPPGGPEVPLADELKMIAIFWRTPLVGLNCLENQNCSDSRCRRAQTGRNLRITYSSKCKAQ